MAVAGTTPMPERYGGPIHGTWRRRFDVGVRGIVRPGMTVLDAGSGRSPAMALDARPDGLTYVGLDLDRAELERAPEGAYDETWERDLAVWEPELEGRFDVVLSLFVLEHVAHVDRALENLRRYLRPGGVLVAQLAGARSIHGMVNRVLPHRLARWVAVRATRKTTYRSAEKVFPAHYHLCTRTKLERAMTGWAEVEIVPQFTGGQYFSFFGPFLRVYLAFEGWQARRGMDDFATWYLIVARA